MTPTDSGERRVKSAVSWIAAVTFALASAVALAHETEHALHPYDLHAPGTVCALHLHADQLGKLLTASPIFCLASVPATIKTPFVLAVITTQNILAYHARAPPKFFHC